MLAERIFGAGDFFLSGVRGNGKETNEGEVEATGGSKKTALRIFIVKNQHILRIE